MAGDSAETGMQYSSQPYGYDRLGTYDRKTLIMRLYYLIWVDLIIRAKSQPTNKNNWQVMTLLYMSVIMAVDFLFLMVILQEVILDHYFYKFEIPILPHAVGNIISFVVLFLGPPLLLNYILIFIRKDLPGS